MVLAAAPPAEQPLMELQRVMATVEGRLQEFDGAELLQQAASSDPVQIAAEASRLPWSSAHTAAALKGQEQQRARPLSARPAEAQRRATARPASAAPAPRSAPQRTPRRKLPPRPASAPLRPTAANAVRTEAWNKWEPDRSVGEQFEQFLQSSSQGALTSLQRRAQFAVFCALVRHRDTGGGGSPGGLGLRGLDATKGCAPAVPMDSTSAAAYER